MIPAVYGMIHAPISTVSHFHTCADGGFHRGGKAFQLRHRWEYAWAAHVSGESHQLRADHESVDIVLQQHTAHVQVGIVRDETIVAIGAGGVRFDKCKIIVFVCRLVMRVIYSHVL